MIIPTCIALLLPEFPRERRATAVALLGAVAAVAAAGGPSLGGLIVDAASWRWIFLVNLPIGLLAWGLGRRVLAEARDPEPGAFPDVAGIVLLAAAVGLIALGLVKSTDWGFADGRVLPEQARQAARFSPCVVHRGHPGGTGTAHLFQRGWIGCQSLGHGFNQGLDSAGRHEPAVDP